MGFLHGSEIIPATTGAQAVTQARSGVILLVGTAPIGPINTPTIVTTKRQGATLFGSQLTGFTIPQALDVIFDQGAGFVVVVNVFDGEETDFTAEVTAESKTVTDGKAQLTYAPIGGEITLTHTSGTPTYEAGTDYTVDDFGKVTVLDFTSIAEGATVKATYLRLDSAGITDAVVIGTDTANVRTGLQAGKDVYPLFGYNPGIVCVPVYNEEPAVLAEMIVLANYLKAIALTDVPAGTTASAAITLRGPGQDLSSVSKRLVILYPHVKRYDVATDATVTYPLSPAFAGVMARVDNLRGYWKSPSNEVLEGLLGAEYLLTSEIGSETSDVNLLNAAGITTVIQGFGTGLKTWGNRSAAFPANTDPDQFISVMRTRDQLENGLQLDANAFVDEPATPALIDAILAAGDARIRVLRQRGALVDGNINFNAGDNTVEEIAAGHLTFSVEFVAPPPAERVTIRTRIDINLLGSLIPQQV